MATTMIDSKLFYLMLANGYRNLNCNIQIIDNLNVFPVPDGDTGKNMTMTIGGGVNNTVGEFDGIGDFMKVFSRNCLLSARGNSGVILSQFIRGIANGTKDIQTLDLDNFKSVYNCGVNQAYKAVVNPVEGTMLTVFREGGEYLSKNNFADFESLFESLLKAMQISLQNTPELLPVLKDANVVDSGGAGVSCIVEGMLKELKGEKVSDKSGNPTEIAATFERCSNSESCENSKKQIPHKKYSVVATAMGEGIIEFFKEIGVDEVIDGGQTNNPSAEQFIKAFERLNSDYIIVLPNDSNIVLTALQAAELYSKSDIRVIKTKSIAEGYSALSMMDLSAATIDELIDGMTAGLPYVTTGYVATATRDAKMNGLVIHKDDWIGFTKDSIISASPDPLDATLKLFENLPDIDEKQVITAFFGVSATEEEMADIENAIKEKYPIMEIGFIEGKQSIQRYIFVIE